uniref:Uncharacterized protein orf63a n=1 Tax=Chara vulgaris TaxID=55564 RepID=Q1ACJ3_CHAVU|nr:hypothetical protein ChvuCp051 [Chara vulgaris]ABA61993.1 hypothetical protein [Chara vulgaris]
MLKMIIKKISIFNLIYFNLLYSIFIIFYIYPYIYPLYNESLELYSILFIECPYFLYLLETHEI